MTCADDAELGALVDGRLEPEALARVERALDGCAHCRRRLGELARRAEGRDDVPAMAGHTLVADLFEPGPDPIVGTVLGGRYRVIRRLGSGGMGAVYEAEHELIGRRVALKLLHPELALRREVLQRFRNEARAAGAIGHPGIVQALDVGRTEAGAPFLVLELLRGRDLDAELAARGPLPIVEAIDIAVAIAEAVAAAHAADIVHRDLKPANVFLCDDGAVKVLDFGISKMRGELSPSLDTGSGVLLGTPLYMAPEQLVDARRADARSDVYAVAAILYRALTGELPRSAASLPALLAAMSDPAPSARARRPEIAAALDLLLGRALSADPHARPATMVELRDAVRSFAATTTRASVRPLGVSERRAVVALVIVEPRDRDGIERLVRDAGGTMRDGHDDALAILGDDSWSGDLVARSASLALELSRQSERVVVGAANLSGASLELSSELRALLAQSAHERGALLVPSFAHATFDGVSVDERGGLARVVGRSAAVDALPLIGRGAELAQIDEALAAAFDDHRPTAVWLSGAPGIGKSRLISMLEAAVRGARVISIRARARDRSSDLALIRGALMALAGLEPGADVERRLAALDAMLRDACDARRASEHRPFLAALLGVPCRPNDPRVSADRARVTAREVLEGLARRRPLALLVDDAQWADAASLDLLGQALAHVDRGFLIALAARDELAAPEWLEDGDVVRIRPRPLRRHETERLLRALLDDAKTDALAERVHAHSGGNPLFVEQLARALRAHDDVAALPLPPTVEGAIQARLHAVDADAREVLKRAAVLGDAFTARDLEALGVDAVEPLLARLLERELIRAVGAEAGLPRFEVCTPLVVEVAYRMLDDGARAELHRRAATLCEGRAPLDVVAGHYDRGGLPKRAASAYAEAALHAKRAGDASKTIACGERALELGLDDAFEVRVALAEAYDARGRLAEQERVLAEAELSVEGAARAAVRTERAVALQRLGRSAEALELLADAVAEAEQTGEPVVHARALGKRSAALVYAGRTQEATDHLNRAERLVLTGASELRAEAAVWRGQLAGATGDLGEQRNAYWAAVELYGALGDLRRQAGASVNLADAYNRIGAHDEAIPALRDALDACARVGMRVMEGYAWANLGYAQLGDGDPNAASASLDQARSIALEVGEERLALAARLYGAKVELARGRAEEAAQLAGEVAESAEARGFKGLEALARCAAARAALEAGHAERALRDAEHALALRDELGGMEEEGGELFCVLAGALSALNRHDDAARARARGRATIEAAAARIGDRHWRERFVNDVEAHRALLGGP